jgi:hypothetical protein
MYYYYTLKLNFQIIIKIIFEDFHIIIKIAYLKNFRALNRLSRYNLNKSKTARELTQH